MRSGREMKEGYLLKRSDTLKRWRPRWFLLDNNSGQLLYKETREDRVVREVFMLANASVGPLQSPQKHLDYFCFYVRSNTLSLILAADSPEAANRWMECVAVAAANASLKASTLRHGSMRPAVWATSIVPKSPVARLGKEMQREEADQLLPCTLDPKARSQQSVLPGSNEQTACQTRTQQAPQPSPARVDRVEESSLGRVPPGNSTEALSVCTPSPVLAAKVEARLTPLENEANGGVGRETPYETPFSSGEPSPSTPPGMHLHGDSEPASPADVFDHQLDRGTSVQGPPPDEVGSLSSLPVRSRGAEQTAAVLLNGSRSPHTSESAARAGEGHPASKRVSGGLDAGASGNENAPFQDMHLGRSSSDSTSAETAAPRSCTARESDLEIASVDSFWFRVPPGASFSSAEYTRHLGPPYGWANVTPRFASQASTPQSFLQPGLHSRKLRAKQAWSDTGAALTSKQRSAESTATAPLLTELHKLSKPQLISMLQLARDALAAKEEQLALMQSVAQIDAWELAKAMKQAEDTASQAQAALVRQQEVAERIVEEKLAKAAESANVEVKHLKDEVDTLRRQLETEKAGKKRLAKELQEMEEELLKHAEHAAQATAKCKELTSQEARCKELEAHLKSLNCRVQGTETALLKPFW